MVVNVGVAAGDGEGRAALRADVLQEWPGKIPGDELGDVEYALTREQWEQDEAARTT